MLDEHLGYVADSVRVERFRTAIGKVVAPGNAVADLGCGSGILGLLCLHAGAKQLWAIDDSAMIEIARETFTRAGFGDRTACIHGKSSQVELPERVDVIVCDHVGYFGFDYGVVEFFADARRRLLKPGGTLIPSKIQPNVAAVGSTKCRELARGWQAADIPAEFHWLTPYAVNSKHAVTLKPDDVLSAPVTLSEIDLHADNPEFFSWKAELHIGRAGVVDGIAGWFECELAEGVWMTNSPLAEQSIDRPQAFLPIAEPITVKAGDIVRATVMARPAEHLIAWVVEFPAIGRRFSHSTLQGMVLTPEDLIRSNPGRIPHLSREGMARMTVLSYCDGTRTAAAIEQAVLREHPDLFPTPTEIAHFVHRVLGRDTE